MSFCNKGPMAFLFLVIYHKIVFCLGIYSFDKTFGV